jgi:predicted ATPase
VQQALYEGVSAHRRRRLHVRVGEVLEQAQAADSTPAELARHFLEGGDRDRAAKYAVRAGETAAARYAHAEAAHHFAIAVAVLNELGDAAWAAEVQCLLAGECFDLNQLSEAVAAYQAALTWFQQRGDRPGQALAH